MKLRSTPLDLPDAPPYARLRLPSGRETVIRTWMAGRSARLLDVAQGSIEELTALELAITEAATAASEAPTDEDVRRIAEMGRQHAELNESLSGYLIGAVWADPGLRLDTPTDDPSQRSAVVAELDDAGWSADDIGALAQAALAGLTLAAAHRQRDVAERVQALLDARLGRASVALAAADSHDDAVTGVHAHNEVIAEAREVRDFS